MARLLVVHHTVSPGMDTLLESVLEGAGNDQIEGVEVVVRAALSASPSEVLEADGYLLGTPANLGYMSGGLKHFFDTIYYPCLHDTGGRPFGIFRPRQQRCRWRDSWHTQDRERSGVATGRRAGALHRRGRRRSPRRLLGAWGSARGRFGALTSPVQVGAPKKRRPRACSK